MVLSRGSGIIARGFLVIGDGIEERRMKNED
jgi:hypothetical protein